MKKETSTGIIDECYARSLKLLGKTPREKIGDVVSKVALLLKANQN